MANPEHLKMLRRGVNEWNAWRASFAPVSTPKNSIFRSSRLVEASPKPLDLGWANLSGAVLDGIDFSGVDLRRADLSRASLTRANLQGTDFLGADLIGANLRWTNLREAELGEVNLSEANLEGADMTKAYLINTNFSRAELGGANFSEANFGSTIFADVDLSTAKGMETARHHSSSTLGLDTLSRSQGNIPEIFLRGCGLSADFINLLPSMVNQPIEYNSSFISYSHKDEEFARRLYDAMKGKNLRVWYAPEDMAGGKKLHEQIDQAIQMHDRLLLVLSEHSMGSEWVKTEIYKARQREIKEQRRILFPVALVPFGKIKEWEFFDADSGKDLGREIREYYVRDFSEWKDHAAFEREFTKLLRDLMTN